MTNQETLEKAIQKAIEGGWHTRNFCTLKGNYKHPEDSEFHDLFGSWHNISPLDIIFNHDFAKALWGEKKIVISEVYAPADDEDYYTFNDHNTPISQEVETAWQYHLQQMVIAEDPIQYLGENL